MDTLAPDDLDAGNGQKLSVVAYGAVLDMILRGVLNSGEQVTERQIAVKLGMSPSGKALKFQHRGPYDDIDSTYDLITAYLDEKGLEAQNLFLEEYLNLPKTSEEDGARVDIYVFLK